MYNFTLRSNLIRLSVIVLVILLITCQSVTAAVSAPSTNQITTTAESAVLMDQNGTILFEKDAHKRLPPASVTKIMTLLLSVEAVEQGRIKLSDQVAASEWAWKQGGSQIWLEPGEIMSVQELMTAVAVVSANDAAVALMEHIYGTDQAAVEAMNNRAAELGLSNTHFSNVNGLPAPNHYMSAYDAAFIAKEALRHPLYMELCGIKEHWLRNGKTWLVNTNKLLWWYKGGDGLKTGWTEEAKYCFVGTAKRDDLRLISAVFATPEPRSHLRESMKIMDWGFANFMAVPIVEKNSVVERISVNKGYEKELQLLAVQDLTLILPKGKSKNIQKKIVAEPTINAPVIQGQKCGELLVIKDGQEIGKVDLVAERNVAKAGFIKMFRSMLYNLFSLPN